MGEHVRKRRIAATVVAALAIGLTTANTAQAAHRDGICDTGPDGEVCLISHDALYYLYVDSYYTWGSWYNQTYWNGPSNRVYSGVDGDQYNVSVADNNDTNSWVRIYYNSGHRGYNFGVAPGALAAFRFQSGQTGGINPDNNMNSHCFNC